MELNLEKPIVFFDIESTGLNIASDSIIELSFVKVFPGGEQKIKTWKIKPWDYSGRRQRPISPSASAVNGVKDEDLKDCPTFIEVVEEVIEWMKDSDLAGFNSTKFDLPILAEEIERVRNYCKEKLSDSRLPEDKKEKAQKTLNALDINLHEKVMVDVQTIYHFMEPRNLRAAYRFYCGGKDFDNAHTAEADTIATYEVLKGQLDMYQEPNTVNEQVLKNDIRSLASIGSRPKMIDYAGRLVYNDKNEATISFGKHKGKTVKEVFLTEPAYFAWIDQGEFTLDTKRQFSLLKEQFEKEKRDAANAPASEEDLSKLVQKFANK